MFRRLSSISQRRLFKPANLLKHYSTKKVDQMITKTQLAEITQPYLLIDVRTEEEVAMGGISNAVNVPIDELSEALGGMSASLFKQQYNAIKPSPSDQLIFYCRSGQRGALNFIRLRPLGNQAVYLASQNGFMATRNLAGGYKNYTDKSKITKSEIQQLMKTGKICLIDVREDHECAEGMIPTAKQLKLDGL
jgi:rhodanese-related sulfurtransferase